MVESSLSFRNGIPYSDRFQDVYFSRDHGLEESRHVFLDGNGLPRHWKNAGGYTIGETGFGTGLNFLSAWQLWQETSPPDALLHFLSVERYPLDRQSLFQCHALFPELLPLSTELLGTLPEQPLPGAHRYSLSRGRVVLTLFHGDAVAMLRGIVASMDCWFLDGFSPARNPQMWSEPLFREIARLSHRGTTFATFTAAGFVRRGLSAQGFRVEKRPGYGRKREMCAGIMQTAPPYRPRNPWFAPPRLPVRCRRALVIGAGIAGAQTAYHLARRGWTVQVLESHDRPASEASGNPVAVYSPFLTARPSLEEQFSLQCFAYLLRHLSSLDPAFRFHQRCGVMALSLDDRRHALEQAIAVRNLPKWLVRPVSTMDVDALCGTPVGSSGLFYPAAGWIDPAAWIRSLLDHPGIRLETGVTVALLDQADRCWQAKDAAGQVIASAPVLVIATGKRMTWGQCGEIPFTRVAGQTTTLRQSALRGHPRCVIRHDGYLVPQGDGRYLIGATYHRGHDGTTMDPAADRENLENLRDALPQLVSGDLLSGDHHAPAHRAVRMTSENRLPLAGALPDPAVLATEYPRMLRRSYREPLNEPVYPPGLYLTAAWGSRGMTQAALGGELLASLVCGEPLPLQADLYHAVHPARSQVRKLKRGIR